MNNRSDLEIALTQRIEKGQATFAKTLIEFIQTDENGAGLDSLNENGQSFLNLALEFGLKEVADLLLKLQKDNHGIIFGVDDDGQTCLWLAAKQGYADIVETIIQQAIKTNPKPNTPGYKIFLQPDN